MEFSLGKTEEGRGEEKPFDDRKIPFASIFTSQRMFPITFVFISLIFLLETDLKFFLKIYLFIIGGRG